MYISKPCGCCGELCTFVKISISISLVAVVNVFEAI